MKNIIHALLFILCFSNAFSQWSGKSDFEKETWSAFKKAKLFVVLQGNEEYDNILKNSFEKYWTFNKYEFIDMSNYDLAKKSTGSFFLSFIKLTRTKDYNDQTFNYIYLMRGSKNGKPQYNEPLADVQFSGAGNEDILTEVNEITPQHLPVFIKYIQWYAGLVTSGKVNDNSDLKKLVKESSPGIKTKPLYVLDSDLNKKIKSEADIKKEYPGEVHVINKTQLKDIIDGDTDAHFLVCVKSDGKAWDYVYNIKTGALLYYGSNVISGSWPAGMIPYHFKDWQ